MNFELAEEHKLVQEMMRDFANNEIIPVGKTLEEQHEFPKDLVSKLAGLGILGMTIPVEFGGIQTDELSFILALEEFGFLEFIDVRQQAGIINVQKTRDEETVFVASERLSTIIESLISVSFLS